MRSTALDEVSSEEPLWGESAAIAEDAAWKHFVLIHGRGSLLRDLAAVLGRSVKEIEAARRSGPSTGKTSAARGGHDFAALFELWHGRPPADADWPAPIFHPGRGSYEWQPPELAMIATLVGQVGPAEIAEALSTRLQQITGDTTAVRDREAVQNQIARMGLQTSDVLGGITAATAGREIGSTQIIYQALRNGALTGRTVGRHLVISHADWAAFKAKIQAPPEGFVQLSTLRERLSIASDKLSEFARMGYVPGAVRVNTFGVHGMHTTKWGSWWVPQAVADQLLTDRREGRPMPWHGKPMLDNLKQAWRRYSERRHPDTCLTCRKIWGDAGAPQDFDAFMGQYHGLDHGAKRHLTRVWTPGLTIAEVAAQSGRSQAHVRRALANDMLVGEKHGGTLYVSQTNATIWIARGANSEASTTWINLESAMSTYFFTREEVTRFIELDQIESKVGMAGAQRGILYLCRQGCALLRDQMGFTEEQAAQRCSCSVETLRTVLRAMDWRFGTKITLTTLNAVTKRLKSAAPGMSPEEAAEGLGVGRDWVQARIDDGTITVARAKFGDALYITPPMLERLRVAMAQPAAAVRLSEEWVRLSRAAAIAGVSIATVIRWAEEGKVQRRESSTGWRYSEPDMRSQARRYWPTARFKRKRLPDWLAAEAKGTSASRDGGRHTSNI
jgi:hypothetical protein